MSNLYSMEVGKKRKRGRPAGTISKARAEELLMKGTPEEKITAKKRLTQLDQKQRKQ